MTAADELERWEAAGGHWRVVDRSGGTVTVALTTCDGGTEMSRVTAPMGELGEYLAGRSSSEEQEER